MTGGCLLFLFLLVLARRAIPLRQMRRPRNLREKAPLVAGTRSPSSPRAPIPIPRRRRVTYTAYACPPQPLSQPAPFTPASGYGYPPYTPLPRPGYYPPPPPGMQHPAQYGAYPEQSQPQQAEQGGGVER